MIYFIQVFIIVCQNVVVVNIISLTLTKLITKQFILLVGYHSKTIQQKTPTQQNGGICFRTETAITDIDKAKAFNKQFMNITLYNTNKINRHIDHTIKNLPTKELRLIITQVQLVISNT